MQLLFKQCLECKLGLMCYEKGFKKCPKIQAAGRIDRLNTPFKDLYYYHLKSKSKIDLDISRSLSNKKNFNEGKYISLFK